MRLFFLLSASLIIILLNTEGYSQPAPRDTFVTQGARGRFLDNLINNTIRAALSDSLSAATESAWSGALWGAELIQYHDSLITTALTKGLSQYDRNSVEFNRSLLQGLYSLSHCDFAEQLQGVLAKEQNRKNFAIAAVYLKRCGKLPLDTLNGLLTSRFPDWEQSPILRGLQRFVSDSNPGLPHFQSLLNHSPLKNHILLISFQRKNRDFPGLLVFRSPGGKFLRNEDGTITAVPQLARSGSKLPSFLTNGNTPQGLFHIAGVVVSKNRFIGKTPALNLELPFETRPANFLLDRSIKDEFNRSHYASLLPTDWHTYAPVFEAFDAGEAGRYDIMAHGTTVDHAFYEGEPYFGFTPSNGCMVASESWNDQTGERLESDQAKILQAYKRIGGGKGYYLLLEIDDKNAPVTIEEIEHLLGGTE